jgi:vacuolar-type H+-ATPase subunit H
MENDILREIIDVEKEIQQSVDQTRLMTREWLDARKKEIEDELTRSENEIQAAFEHSREIAIEDARKKALNIVADAEQQAARIFQINNDDLKNMVSSNLRKILPG